MPHSAPVDKVQAIILCGPGVSFTTFASNPDDFPKALIPIANRPMVWYPLDLCNRMGIDNVALVIPRTSEHSISQALETNLHLMSLPNRPKLVAPKNLELTTGTAAIFRLPEVRDLIKGSFAVLPCDLVCELPDQLMNTWLLRRPLLEPTDLSDGSNGGGFTMWYDTKAENSVKGEETDFLMTTPFDGGFNSCRGRALTSTTRLVYAMPTDTLNDTTEENHGSLPIRHGLVRKHPRLKIFTQHRDSHFYVFPAWVVDMINKNEHMDSLAEDVIGWWAKAGWQDGLGEKLGLRQIFQGNSSCKAEPAQDGATVTPPGVITGEGSRPSSSKSNSDTTKLIVPCIHAYFHPSYPGAPLVRRVDTAPLLLSISLRMAKLESIDQVGPEAASPFAHQAKVPLKAPIAWGKCSISQSDCLIGHKVRIEEKCQIKESVIGNHSQILAGAKLTRCVVMEGVTIGKGCKLTGCIIGRKVEIGEFSTLTDCEVQDNHKVEPKTEEKNEKIMSSEGLEAGNEELISADENESQVDDEGDD